MSSQPQRSLTLFDSTCLIVGIIMGVGIYQMTPTIATAAGGTWVFLGLWVVGGVLSLLGALNYAELATTYPREGGDYVYLTRAYGPWAGFMFGWIQLLVARPGDIAIVAFAFAMYAHAIGDPLTWWFAESPTYVPPLEASLVASPGGETGVPLIRLIYASLAVVVLTLVNILGVHQGKWTQNILTTVKVIGVLAIVVAAILIGSSVVAPADAPHEENAAPTSTSAEEAASPPTTTEDAESATADEPASEAEGSPSPALPLTLGVILVLFTFGGWNEMAYVAAEVRDFRRNIVRAILLGVVSVTAIYLLMAVAFIYVLGYDGVVASENVATDAMTRVFPTGAGLLVSVLVCISALGAVNGLIFTGARISYAVGVDHALFRGLGRWNPATGTPVRALIVQGTLALLLIFLLGDFVSTIIYTTAAVYTFYFFTMLSVITLRDKDPQRERPYRAWGYPLSTVLFAAVCLFLTYEAIQYSPNVSMAAFAAILIGLPIYFVSNAIWPADLSDDSSEA